jgi:adenine phosphoribosyltransferase
MRQPGERARNLKASRFYCKWRRHPLTARAIHAKVPAVDQTDLDKLKAGIRDVLDFPKKGVVFKDITPVLGDPELFELAIDGLIETAAGHRVDKIVGIDARGFIFGAVVADRMGAGLVPVRKHGKLPWKTKSVSFTLEYGDAVIEIHEDAIKPGENVLLVDDLLATGGTAAAAVELVRSLGGNLLGASFFIELGFLEGRKMIGEDVQVDSLLSY